MIYAGFTEIVQSMLNFAGSPDFVMQMLSATDIEGDTVNFPQPKLSFLSIYFFNIRQPGNCIIILYTASASCC